MKKIYLILPILFILIFIFVMNMAFFIRPYIKSVPEQINQIENNIISGNWQQAQIELELFKKNVNNKMNWLQVSIERDEMDQMLLDISKLSGNIRINDTDNAITSLYEIRYNWDNLGK